ncbi:Crp/Fnr family transcriptional regulator [Pedobacter sp. L105]|uniref:Crp/Fnr family transcriptional regulator n=1 Tax=Pedobacter sp. L105 TaxID=1641871 RepID=UPI00131AAE16|nr:Crp/Fnr family transcriptional regulator [Pedobacter sp. L105]
MQLSNDPYRLFKQFLSLHLEADDQITEFCKKFKHKKTKKNELLLSVDEVCSYLYFVNSGCLRIYLLDNNGNESTRFLVTENKFGTSFPSFKLQEPSLASIQSLEPADLLYISYKDFNVLLHEYPAWERIYRIILEKEYIESIKRIESLITMDAKQRYQALMETSPSFIQRFPSRMIADYLGISQETLSRLKSKR